MLNLVTFIIGIIVIFLLARYNKSNKLFWMLLLSMLSGFVGGSIAANMKNVKKSNVEYVSQSTTPCNMPVAQFMLSSNNEEVVPIVETSAVHYFTANSTTLSKKPSFTILYHEGLVPFIFDSS